MDKVGYRFPAWRICPVGLLIGIWSISLMGGWCAFAIADEATDTFNQLFGEEVRRVSATRGADDDLTLARSMITAAETVDDKPALVRVLLDNAHRLASKDPAGHETAILALEQLVARVPEAAAEATEQMVTLLLRRFGGARGDEKAVIAVDALVRIEAIADGQLLGGDAKGALQLYKRATPVAAAVDDEARERIRLKTLEAANQQRLDAEIDALKNRLKTSPNDKTLGDELIRMLIVEKDNPDEAGKYSFLADESAVKLIRAASQDADGLDADTALALGKWYYDWSVNARSTAKLAMLTRADRYYRQYLDQQKVPDLQTAHAQLMAGRISEEMAKLSEQSVSPVRAAAGKPKIVFHADRSMQLFPVGTVQGVFPRQETDDARGPFLGQGVYFQQRTGQDVVYELSLPRPIKQIYWKGAAMSRMTMTLLDTRGKVLATSGPHAGGNTWGEFTLDVPRSAGTRFFLQLHNEISTWYYVNAIEFK